ncbi:MAG: hypothetical protein N2170_01305 [Bacteroidia bacterium]|nr:hypothetical protein [Bacteroidia bacterium]
MLRGWMCLLLIGWSYTQGTDPWEEELFEDLFAPSSSISTDSRDTLPSSSGMREWDDTLLSPSKPPAPLRLIDSPLWQDLTIDPRTNAKISTNRPFQVKIVRPKVQNNKGHPLIHGFDKWYLYVVKAEEVRINGRILRSNGLPIYMTIVSLAPQIEELPAVLESPALMLKGIVDYGDTITKYFKQEKKRLRGVLDSLLKLPLPPEELQADAMEKLLERVGDSLVYAEAHYELYKAFRQAKRSGKGLVQFFLSFPLNRTLTYSIYSAPYALPRYFLPQESDAPGPPEERKKRRRS